MSDKLALVQKPGTDLIQFSSEQVALMKNTVAKGLADNEFLLFLSVAKKRGLDPILKQVHAVKRGGKDGGGMTIQTGIDGFRLMAARTGEYAGRDEAEFTYKGAVPDKCKVTVYRLVQGTRCAFTATAKWAEYCPDGGQAFMWKKMPETMLEKCCEAKALRMAFPGEMSGIYVDEEMHQADNRKEVKRAEVKIPKTVSAKSNYADTVPDVSTQTGNINASGPNAVSVPSLAEKPITFGNKFRGKTYGEVDPDELRDYVEFVKTLEKLNPAGENFVLEAEEFLEG